MFDIGVTELVVVTAIALVVLGPEKLPLFFRTIGTLIGKAQNYVSEVKDDIQKQIELEELSKTKENISQIGKEVNQDLSSIEKGLSDITEGLNKNIQPDSEFGKKNGFFIGSPPLNWPEENSYVRLRDRLLERNKKRLFRNRKL